MSEPKSLIDANLERAIYMAEILARRVESIGTSGAWHGYQASEGLNGVRIRDNILRYDRPGYGPDTATPAALTFFDPKFTDAVHVDFGEERVVQKDVIERYRDTITKIKGVAFTDKITHTFSATQTLQQALKVGAEEAIEGGFSEAGASVKVSAKLTEEYQRQWGDSETHSDTVERTLVLPEDFEGDINYEAVRSTDKVERTITATANMDYGISFVSGPTMGPNNYPYYLHHWDSLEQFIEVGKGFASAERALFDAFMAMKLTDEEIEHVRKIGEQSVEFDANYDNVQSQEIRIL